MKVGKLGYGYVALTSFMYLFFAIWCTLMPGSTSKAIGFSFPLSSGLSEYFVVYGGFELSLAIFGIWACFKKEWIEPTLILFVIQFCCLAVFRIATLTFLDGDLSYAKVVGGLEVSFAFLGLFVLWMNRKV